MALLNSLGVMIPSPFTSISWQGRREEEEDGRGNERGKNTIEKYKKKMNEVRKEEEEEEE